MVLVESFEKGCKMLSNLRKAGHLEGVEMNQELSKLTRVSTRSSYGLRTTQNKEQTHSIMELPSGELRVVSKVPLVLNLGSPHCSPESLIFVIPSF